MEKISELVLTFLLGSVAGVAIKNWFDYQYTVYKELWGKRHESYKLMFKISAALPLYPAPLELTHETLRHTSEQIRDWYFEGGGLLLSANSRDAYFNVQKNIRSVLATKATMVDAVQYEQIREALSALRTEFTNDLMSRRRVQLLPPIKKSDT